MLRVHLRYLGFSLRQSFPVFWLFSPLILASYLPAQNIQSVATPSPNQHFEVAYNPKDGYVYAATSGGLPIPSAITLWKIDPRTAHVVTTVTAPIYTLNDLQVTFDGDYLYLEGFGFTTNYVVRYHLPGLELDAQFDIGFSNTHVALAVSPADPHVYATTTNFASSQSAVSVYRDGRLLATAPNPGGGGDLAFISATRLIAVSIHSIHEFSVADTAVTWDGVTHTISDVIGPYREIGSRVKSRDQWLYTNGGLKIDTNTWTVEGQLYSYTGQRFDLNPAGDTYYASTTTARMVYAFSPLTFKLASIASPPQAAVPNGTVYATLACGADQIALSKDGALYFIPVSTFSPVSNTIPTPSPLSVGGMSRLNMPVNSMLYDKSRDLVYATTPGIAGNYGNSLVVIDPSTATVQNTVYVGSTPSTMAISESGSALHVALNGSRVVATVNPSTLSIIRTTPLADSQSPAVFPADSVSAVPGSDTAFVTTRQLGSLFLSQPSAFPTAVAYNDGLPLSSASPAVDPLVSPGVSPGTVYQWGRSDSNGAGITKLSVDQTGVHVDAQQTIPIMIAGVFGDTIYTSNGTTYQFGSAQPVGNFKVNGSRPQFAVSPDAKTLYFTLLNPGCFQTNIDTCNAYPGGIPSRVIQVTAIDRSNLNVIGRFSFTVPVNDYVGPLAPAIVATRAEVFLNFGAMIIRVPLSTLGESDIPNCSATGFTLSPNPILASGVSTSVTFSGTSTCGYEIRRDSPSGQIVASGKTGAITASANLSLTDGDTFFLQMAGISGPRGTLAVVSAHVRDSLVASCTVKDFSINPSPIFADGPYGVATLTGNTSCDYDVRVGNPGGALFASGTAGQFTATTGNWVIDNLVFYLQARGYKTSAGTLATVTAKVRPQSSSLCTATGFGSSPNPIRTNEAFASTTITGKAGCSYDIRIGSPSGALFASGDAGTISAQTGPWVTDGMEFYLQQRGDATDAGTLAVFRAKLQPAGVSSCAVHGLTASPNPIRSSSLLAATTIIGSADCPYDIRIGSPDGELFASGMPGNISAKTGNWVTDGLTFYLQAHDDTTSLGTLGMATAHVLSDQSTSACTVSAFAVKDSPITSNRLLGTITLTGNVSCAYDVRVGSPDGPLFASGEKGSISAPTGHWVTDGMEFYLQPSGDTTSSGTLAITTAKLQAGNSSCTVGGFSATPIIASGAFGTTTLVGTVGCDYEIRVGGPDGALFAAGNKGSLSAATGNWATDGMTFYLQMRGSTTRDGTLAIAKATESK
jgi:hypothetical protein